MNSRRWNPMPMTPMPRFSMMPPILLAEPEFFLRERYAEKFFGLVPCASMPRLDVSPEPVPR